jgi:hypothetical protein
LGFVWYSGLSLFSRSRFLVSLPVEIFPYLCYIFTVKTGIGKIKISRLALLTAAGVVSYPKVAGWICLLNGVYFRMHRGKNGIRRKNRILG